jgi:hypothetical protein
MEMLLVQLSVWISSLIVLFQIKLLKKFIDFYPMFIWKLQIIASNKR